ncbi:hypothetical protein P8625_15595 [Tenacibaculum tangerinum]|uniref:Lipocalin-like domain-containing protein n=1 Tax=Tenacibaculum tangerinum TaxID=3038772 RepID=A0ABY8L2H6_9FLAO|nr:hypothetical protein [Tenacibaculum tangerinum]WGH75471.1 hypothetical protein P8625_15595 [Tenacibaculum tangerinum]
MNLKSLILFLFSLVLLWSCTEENDTPISNNIQIENNLKNGVWKITSFIDSGTDKTIDFLGYNFTFDSSGVLYATNEANNYQGTWSITNSNSNDDSQEDLDFNINFNLTNNFVELNEDWDFVSHSSTKIALINISGGDGDTDYLTFEKK